MAATKKPSLAPLSRKASKERSLQIKERKDAQKDEKNARVRVK